MLQSATALAREGCAIIWLRKGEKRPVDSRWTSLPRATASDLEASYKPGLNVGVRLGKPSKIGDFYLHVLDVDVKGDRTDEEEAYLALADLLPKWEDFPYVESGRGGGSAHIYFVCEQPLTKSTLAKSKGKIEWIDGEGKKHSSNRWEIQLLGTGQQVVLPPSIHPDTKREYRWGRELDFDAIDRGFGPIIEGDEVKSWIGDMEDDEGGAAPADTSSMSLADLNKRKSLGLDADQAWRYLSDLDLPEWCEDYDGWLKVGMALHHEFEASDEGLDLWHEWSEQAANYDADVLDDKWKSFGKDKRRRPVRFATIINAGAVKRLKRDLSGADADDTIDDLEDDTAWMGRLDLNEKGQIKSHLGNITRIIENDPRIKGILAYNLFTRTQVIRGTPGYKKAKSEKRQKQFRQLEGDLWKLNAIEKREGKSFEDSHMNAIRLMIEEPIKHGGYGIKVSDRDLLAARDTVAQRNRYHPVQEYLEGVKWDGEERLDYLFVDWLGCEDTAYYRQTASLFCVAAVARVYEPGHKFDYAPIIEGLQGIGKSTFIRLLARDWFVELSASFDDDKRIVETLGGQWIAELPELSQFGRADIAAVKAFFSKCEDKVRLSYRRDEETFKRQTVFMGSTNDREYLRDPTGGRRFWPIACLLARIDTKGFAKVVDQIWAEAYARYLDMVDRAGSGRNLPLYLTGEAATDTALELQETRRVETQADAWAGMIEQWFNTPVRQSVLDGKGDKFDDESGNDDPLVKRELTCGLEVWVDALGQKPGDYGRAASLRLVDAIRMCPSLEDAGRQRTRKHGIQRAFRRRARAPRTLEDIL